MKSDTMLNSFRHRVLRNRNSGFTARRRKSAIPDSRCIFSPRSAVGINCCELSLGYYNIILLAKRIRKFRLLLEVEEIYQDVSPVPHMLRLWEYRTFRIADGYIFSTELLNEKINVARKPCVVIYGTYRVEPQIAVRPDDGTVHVVYAGTFDIRKGGAAAAAAAEFLPGNYHVHILGFGNEKDTAQIRRIIEQTASRSTAKVTFE